MDERLGMPSEQGRPRSGHGEVGTGCVGLTERVGSGGEQRQSHPGAHPVPRDPCSVPSAPKGAAHTWHKHKTICQRLPGPGAPTTGTAGPNEAPSHQRDTNWGHWSCRPPYAIIVNAIIVYAIIVNAIIVNAIIVQPQIQRHPGSCRGRRERRGGPSGGCGHTLPPAGDLGCALRNAEATQCKFFGFVAAAPLPWSRRREQTQLAPCFLSTFHPTAFGPSASPRHSGPALAESVPHPARSRASEMEQSCSQPALGKGGTALVRGLTRDIQGWQGMERRSGQECRMERVRMCRGLQLQPSLANGPSPSCMDTTARGQERSLQPPREDERRVVESLQ
ncbi:hypothetical protein Nmel_017578 [Mimus melanotis]